MLSETQILTEIQLKNNCNGRNSLRGEILIFFFKIICKPSKAIIFVCLLCYMCVCVHMCPTPPPLPLPLFSPPSACVCAFFLFNTHCIHVVLPVCIWNMNGLKGPESTLYF